MGKQLIDYSAGVPRASAVKAAGFAGAVRYVSPARDAWMKGKPIRKPEADDYQAHGLELVSVYQNLKEDWRRGRTGGVVDATDAVMHHLEAGGPKGAVIYCAIDSNPTPEEFRSHALPYIEGFWDTLATLGYRRGVYCNTKVMGWLEGRNFTDFLWWKHGWGSDARIEGAAIHQYEIDKFTVDGIGVDRNHVYADDYGQWSSVTVTEPAPTPTPPKEESPVTSGPEYVLTGTQFPCDVNIYTAANSGTRDPFATQYSVFHTTENGDSTPVENVARWQQNTANGSSYNVLFGTDGKTVRSNDDNRIPWSAGNPGNVKGNHASSLGQAARTREHWFRFPKQLESAARWAADEHLRYGRPFVWLSPADIKAKKRGFTSHGNVYHGDGGPAYRSDPGAGFPHDWVLNRALEMVSGPKDPNAFPLPKGWYYGPLSGPNESISGEFGTELPAWIEGLKRWQAAVGIPETGIWDEATRRVATELQKEKGWPNNTNWAEINGGFGGVYEGEWNAVILEDWKPGSKVTPAPTPKPDIPDDEYEDEPDEEDESPSVITKQVGKIKDISGPGVTDKYGINATDLGISVRMDNGEILTIFGDSFSGGGVGQGEWRSPVGLISKTTNLEKGIEWDRAAGPDHDQARQLMPYVHNQGFSTVLPSDLVVLPDGTIVMHVMVNEGLGNVLWTELQVSKDNAKSWQNSGVKFGGDWNSGFRQLWTMEYNPDDGFVYAFSTGFQRNKGIILHRIHWEEMLKAGSEGRWEPWGYSEGKWAWGNPATVILPGRFGEMYLRRLDKGYWTLTYFNAEHYRIDTMVFDSPIANMFHARAEQKTLLNGGAWGRESDTHVAQLYCGAPIPGSTPDRWHYVVSQWNTSDSAAGKAGWPYKSMQFVNSIPVPVGYNPPAPEGPVIDNPDEPSEVVPENPKDDFLPVEPRPEVSGGTNFMEVLIKAILSLFGLGR